MTVERPHSDTPPAGNSVPLGGIGRSLRHAREARGLTLGDAAHALKLIQRQVEALEAEQFERLPGTAFARGFLRNYARLLHLDPEPLIAEFDAHHAGAVVELRQLSNAHGALPAGGVGRGPSAMPAALAAAGLLGLVVAGWYFDWFRQPELPAQVETPVPAAALPPVVPPTAEASPAAAPGPVAPTSTEAPVAAEPSTAPVVAGSVSAPPPPTIPPAEDAAPGPDGLERLSFSFDKESWVEVRDASGEIIYSRINQAGSTQEVQGKGPFALVVGNAPSVRLSHNGKPVDLVPYTKVSVARLTVK